MTQYIKKIKAPVRISRVGEAPLDGHLFLSPNTPVHPGPQTVLERLNTADRVIPFERAADRTILLLSPENVMCVAPGGQLDPGLFCPPTWFVTREERVRLRLADGLDLEGMLRLDLPVECARASDFMNGPGDFFPLATPREILLINKRRVLEMVVTESPPAPVQAAGSAGKG